MHLRAVDVQDFRNIAHAAIEPAPRATILVGANGQGKTNFLEAIYYACTLKPLRTSRLADLIRFERDSAAISIDVESTGGSRRVSVEVTAGTRTPALDGKVLSPGELEEYFAGLAAVCFCPDDLLLVKAGPEGRRRFLDRAAFNRWPAVLSEARDYLRALRSRNAALRNSPPEVERAFRSPLARTGARLLRRRRQLLAELGPRFERAFAEISGPDAPVARLSYRVAGGLAVPEDEQALTLVLAEELDHRADRDRDRGFTSIGPHMDDLVLVVGDHSARTFASQGQQRALVLALKVAEIENLRALLGRPPLLLLDDVSSELDPAKNAYLLGYLSALPGQVFLTTTDRRLLEAAAGPDATFFSVQSGTLTRQYS